VRGEGQEGQEGRGSPEVLTQGLPLVPGLPRDPRNDGTLDCHGCFIYATPTFSHLPSLRRAERRGSPGVLTQGGLPFVPGLPRFARNDGSLHLAPWSKLGTVPGLIGGCPGSLRV